MSVVEPPASSWSEAPPSFGSLRQSSLFSFDPAQTSWFESLLAVFSAPWQYPSGSGTTAEHSANARIAST